MMDQNLFQLYVLGGGWAMLLLVPASIVAVATTLRGLAVLFTSAEKQNAAELITVGNAIVRPLAIIYMLAPMIGAVAAAWRMVTARWAIGADNSADYNTLIFSAFVPLAWGVTVGLIAVFAYCILQARLRKIEIATAFHSTENIARTSRSPSGWVALIAIIVAAGLCGASMLQLKRDVIPALPNITLAPPAATTSAAMQPAADTTILEISVDAYNLNGKPIAPGDLLFRLSALAIKSPVIIIKVTADDMPASRLTEALLIINQAGFTQIGIQ